MLCGGCKINAHYSDKYEFRVTNFELFTVDLEEDKFTDPTNPIPKITELNNHYQSEYDDDDDDDDEDEDDDDDEYEDEYDDDNPL